MSQPLVLWADVAEHERMPDWASQSTWRGCKAAARSSDTPGFRRCAREVLKTLGHGFCRHHAERAGLLAPAPGDARNPYDLPQETYNVIRRMVGRRLSLAEFRRLPDSEFATWRNVGRVRLAMLRQVRDDWSDTDLIAAFGFGAAEPGVCTWVGEAIGAG